MTSRPLPRRPVSYRSTIRATSSSDRRIFSPRSEIQLRLLERTERTVDAIWWRERLASCLARRAGIDASAYRVVHAEGDGLPSLIVDRYDRWVVAQLLSAGLETMRGDIVTAIADVLEPEGILLRHDNSTRQREGLSAGVELVMGDVPQSIDVREGAVHYLAAPWTGQKTGAFLDQRPNRMLLGCRGADRRPRTRLFRLPWIVRPAPRRALRMQSWRSTRVPKRSSAGRQNAQLNGFDNISWTQGDAFDVLRGFRSRSGAVRRDRARPAGVREVTVVGAAGAQGVRRGEPAGDADPGAGRRPR